MSLRPAGRRPGLRSARLTRLVVFCAPFALLGCSAGHRLDRDPTPRLHRGQDAPQRAAWPAWEAAPRPTPAADRPLPGPAEPGESITVGLDEVEQAIERFQLQRRGSGPALDSAWPPLLETLDLYLDQAPERLSLSPLVRARVALEYELDCELRRPLGTPEELQREVLGLVIRIDRKMRALRTLASSAVRPDRRPGQPGLQWPVTRGAISSGFGTRRDPIQTGRVRFHAGIDLSAGVNEPVYAAADGKVIQAGWNGPAGRSVRLAHPDGLETLYAHLAMVMVQEGQLVEAGGLLGLLGSSGRVTGPHLHFAVYQSGKAVDPLDHLREVPMSFSEDLPGIVFGWGQ